MRKILATLLVSAALIGTAMAGIIVVESSDSLIGYDGSCQVYWRSDFGYFEVCQSGTPIFLGIDFDVITFRSEFREGPVFFRHFGRHFVRGGHFFERRDWTGRDRSPRVEPRIKTHENTNINQRGRDSYRMQHNPIRREVRGARSTGATRTRDNRNHP